MIVQNTTKEDLNGTNKAVSFKLRFSTCERRLAALFSRKLPFSEQQILDLIGFAIQGLAIHDYLYCTRTISGVISAVESYCHDHGISESISREMLSLSNKLEARSRLSTYRKLATHISYMVMIRVSFSIRVKAGRMLHWLTWPPSRIQQKRTAGFASLLPAEFRK